MLLHEQQLTFFFFFQISRHQVMQKHDQFSIHSHTDVVCKFSYYTAFHLWFNTRIYSQIKIVSIHLQVHTVHVKSTWNLNASHLKIIFLSLNQQLLRGRTTGNICVQHFLNSFPIRVTSSILERMLKIKTYYQVTNLDHLLCGKST